MSSVAPEDVLSEVSAVDIDDRGIFKYILIDVRAMTSRIAVNVGEERRDFYSAHGC